MRASAVALALFVCCAACGGPPVLRPDAGAVQVQVGDVGLTVLGGTWADGSPAEGLALLLMLAAADGGPDETWNAHLRDDSNRVLATFAYGPSATPWVARWWPEIPRSFSSRYTATLESSEGRRVSADFSVAAQSGLDRPQPALAPDGGGLEWPAVAGAAAYECRLQQLGGGVTLVRGASPACGTGGLADGSYEAAVTAFSLETAALTPASTLPRAFDVAVGRLAFTTGVAPAQLRASGGAIRFAGAGEGLAVVAEVVSATGGATPGPWEVTVEGPGLPASAPLGFNIPAAERRHLAWTYDVAPREGEYLVKAASGPTRLALTMRVASPAQSLSEPTNIVATPKGAGGADVAWAPVAGSRTYYASVWRRASGEFVSGAWTAEPSFTFLPGSLPAGVECDVYVAATNVDLLGQTGLPPVVLVSENTFQPAGLTPR